MPDVSTKDPASPQEGRAGFVRCYWSVLDTEEKALLAFEPTRRMVPTTNTKITASITAYSEYLARCHLSGFGGENAFVQQLLSTAKDFAPALAPCQSKKQAVGIGSGCGIQPI